MARINVDDDVESRPEYRKLLKLMNGDDDRALGMLVRFWRHAQRLWAHGKLVSSSDMEEWGWQALIDSKWAVEREGGFYAIGSEERFAWYLQRVASASAGGRARSAAPRDEKGRLLPESSRAPAGIQPDAGKTQPTSSPLAPSLAPVIKNTTTTENPAITRKEIHEAWGVWCETLRHFEIPPSKMNQVQEGSIARAILSLGFESVKHALRGPRFEGGKDYDPKKFLSVDRCLHKNAQGQSSWERLANLSRANPEASREVYNPEDAAS